MTAGFCGQSTLAQGLPNKGAGSLLPNDTPKQTHERALLAFELRGDDDLVSEMTPRRAGQWFAIRLTVSATAHDI